LKNVDEDPRKRTITRELRIREDTAKYLLNLDPNSATYSGKSRTMSENPNPEK
jgi:pre-mRNA-processing factor SLU7